MNWKIRLTVILAAVVFFSALFFFRTPVQPTSKASSPDDGMILPETRGKARFYPNGVVKVEAENFAISPALKDLRDANTLPPRKNPEQRREEEQEERWNQERRDKGLPPLTEKQLEELEQNAQNAERVKKIVPGAGLADKNFTDPLLFEGNRGGRRPQSMPTPSLTFDGAGSADNVSAGLPGSVVPPDTNGAVGPNHYVSSVNLVVKIFDKSGGVLAAGKRTSDLFNGLPAADPCRTQNDGDPLVVYDQLADRWIISQFSIPGYRVGSGKNYECIAVSTTADPTGSYFTWSYVLPNYVMGDYPKMGVWPDAYHVTVNQFTDAGKWAGAGVLSQDRAKALTGDAAATVVYSNFYPMDTRAGGILAATVDGFVPPPTGMSEVLAEFRSIEYGYTGDVIKYYKWVPDFVTPAHSVLEVLSDVTIAPFDPRSPGSRAQNEVLSGVALDAISDRLMHRFTYRNLGTAASPVNSYTGNFTVNVSGVDPTTVALYQTGIRWFEMRRTGDTFTVRDQGTHSSGPIDPANGLNDWMGSIAQDNQGNIALGFSQSSINQFADIKVAGRGIAASGTMDMGESLMYAAGGAQTTSVSRWGDYSSMTVDPSDDCTFWYTQEYYAATSVATFSTRVGKFAFPGCTAPARGTISGTVTNCSSGLPVSGAWVTASGGFQRMTGADGTYSMTAAAGDYSVQAGKVPAYLAAPVNSTVTDGGDTTVNICISGIPLISSGSPLIVTESGGLSNGIPDPGEQVTVSVPLSNVGMADTSNLVATLQTTGGVVAGSAQTYGVVTASGPSVNRNFTFTTDPATVCGAGVTLTWVLTDGATDMGTVTKTYGTGTPVVSISEGFDGLTAPALPAGWTNNRTNGTYLDWTTSTTNPRSSPNTAFANDPAHISAASLESPAFTVGRLDATVSFQKAYTTDDGFDGAVLEIKIGSGAWTDIIDAGGVFLSGGYTKSISTVFGSPILGRMAWSGTSAAFTETKVLLPPTAYGQSVQIRWLMASDATVPSTGFRVDDITVTAGAQCSMPTAGGVNVNGRILTADGRGIRNAEVTLSGGGLDYPVHAQSGPFGWYQFSDIAAGRNYVIAVGAKRYKFAAPSRIIFVGDSIADADFTANR